MELIKRKQVFPKKKKKDKTLVTDVRRERSNIAVDSAGATRMMRSS